MRNRALLVGALFLAACASAPRSVDPPRLRAALEAESDGAKRYQRGDYLVAARRFTEAAQIFASIDNATGIARNRLHLARAELAQGKTEAALQVLELTDPSDNSLALETLLIKAQTQLGLGRVDAARQNLDTVAVQCDTACPLFASLNLLQARTALANKHAANALAHAQTALTWLKDKDEAAETGNAWRLIAAAHLAGGKAGSALPAAQTALEIDRKLALPEKIASDWILIGDIRRTLGNGGDTAAAYQRALDISKAAALSEMTGLATRALAEINKPK
ncbi:MAG: hypothetical protein K9J74_13145 [Sulfuritalea sp.]|nr:hypothetical protein [Sulfuritalea sp.]